MTIGLGFVLKKQGSVVSGTKAEPDASSNQDGEVELLKKKKKKA